MGSRNPRIEVPETCHEMIVDHAHGLHERITDRAADEREAASLEVFTHRVGFVAACRHFRKLRPVVLLRQADDEAPDVLIEGAELLLHFKKGLRVAHRRGDLEPVANDAGIRQKFGDLFVFVAGYDTRIETIECDSVVLTLFENRFPTQSRLGTFEDQKLEQ